MDAKPEEECHPNGIDGDQEHGSGVVCPGCGYDLSGRVGSRCSECGLGLRVIAADQGRFHRHSGTMLLASWAVLIGVVLAVVFGMTVVNGHRSQLEGWEDAQARVVSMRSSLTVQRAIIARMGGMAGGSDQLESIVRQFSDIEEMAEEMSLIKRPTFIDKGLVIPELGFGLSLLGIICAVLALLANRIVVRSIRDEGSGVSLLERWAGVLSFAAVWGCSLALVVLAWETIR